MVFRSEKNDRITTISPLADGLAAQRAAAIDLSDSLTRLYHQAIRLGHVEAALFIGCANLSISETLALEGVSGPVASPAKRVVGK